jgi:hypothetical protein
MLPCVSQVVCTEAIGAKVVPVAKEALVKLHERISAGGEGIAPGDEASVLRCLIRLTAGRLPRTIPCIHLTACKSFLVTCMRLTAAGMLGN